MLTDHPLWRLARHRVSWTVYSLYTMRNLESFKSTQRVVPCKGCTQPVIQAMSTTTDHDSDDDRTDYVRILPEGRWATTLLGARFFISTGETGQYIHTDRPVPIPGAARIEGEGDEEWIESSVLMEVER